MPKSSEISTDIRVQLVEGMHRILSTIDSSILRPGQKAVMHDLEAFFVHDEKGYVAMPTGSGKTVIFKHVLAQHEVKSLVVVPTKQLLDQTISELTSQGIYSVSTPIDTRAYGRREKYDKTQVIVTTYAQLVRSARTPHGRYVINPADFGLVILDEAHHAQAEGATFAMGQFNNAFQVGFTATPDYSEARKLTDRLPKVIHEMSISEAIDMGMITKFANTLLVTEGDMSGVTAYNGDYDKKQLDEALNTHGRNQAIANFYMTKFVDKKTVFSCNSVEHSRALAAEVQRAGGRAAAVYGQMPNEEFKDIMARFKTGEFKALFNNKLLTEGFDDPSIEVIINASPTLSPVRQQQRTGRGLRIDPANPGKELIIVDCIDANYQKRPMFFFDDMIAGTTGLETINETTKTMLANASTDLTDGLELMTSEAAIHDYVSTMRLSARSKPDRSIATVETQHGVVKHLLGHTVINGILQRSTPRGYKVGNEQLHRSANGICAQTDPEAFFPEKGGSTREAKKMCSLCDIREDCLEIALESGDRFGIWGGLSERERRKLAGVVVGFAGV